ncbi:hypothetical protein L227DRAFT_87553 [Lentinus tigrinus ALCF2SS1-6]|uniref:Uncharacterized protein n=1 Tax=Lentinus tigrinus ALCF2SS1-6 TaxID=1328759 RepID=A0A5C2SB09_9APHY|nr:hypothetical protein L227DRAFT_87553 [Lentinus tigrinus ALCF2SS1-6]
MAKDWTPWAMCAVQELLDKVAFSDKLERIRGVIPAILSTSIARASRGLFGAPLQSFEPSTFAGMRRRLCGVEQEEVTMRDTAGESQSGTGARQAGDLGQAHVPRPRRRSRAAYSAVRREICTREMASRFARRPGCDARHTPRPFLPSSSYKVPTFGGTFLVSLSYATPCAPSRRAHRR